MKDSHAFLAAGAIAVVGLFTIYGIPRIVNMNDNYQHARLASPAERGSTFDLSSITVGHDNVRLGQNALDIPDKIENGMYIGDPQFAPRGWIKQPDKNVWLQPTQ